MVARLSSLYLLVYCLHAATVYMVLGYGQSTSLGADGTPAISTSQPYSNTCVNVAETALVSLIEGTNCWGNTSPAQESPNSSAGNNATSLSPSQAFAATYNNNGFNGTPIAGLQPATLLLSRVSAANTIATNAGNSLVVLAVLFTEGDTDWTDISNTYKADSLSLQSYLQTNIKAITGQAQSVPFIFSQLSSMAALMASCTASPGNTPCGKQYNCPYDSSAGCIDDYTGAATPYVPISQWQLYRDYPKLFILVGPKYQLASADGGSHFTAQGYNYLGATMARAIYDLERGCTTCYEGVYPSTIGINGSTVTIAFKTPLGLGLTIDTATLGNPQRNGITDTVGHGFQFFEQGSSLTDSACSGSCYNGGITGVSCSSQTCTITLSGTPTGSNQRIAYGFEGTVFGVSGTAASTQGNVRTLVDYTDINGDPVYYWAPAFNEKLGFQLGVTVASNRAGNVTSGGHFTAQ